MLVLLYTFVKLSFVFDEFVNYFEEVFVVDVYLAGIDAVVKFLENSLENKFGDHVFGGDTDSLQILQVIQNIIFVLKFLAWRLDDKMS